LAGDFGALGDFAECVTAAFTPEGRSTAAALKSRGAAALALAAGRAGLPDLARARATVVVRTAGACEAADVPPALGSGGVM
jgi:hypothetical protein